MITHGFVRRRPIAALAAAAAATLSAPAPAAADDVEIAAIMAPSSAAPWDVSFRAALARVASAGDVSQRVTAPRYGALDAQLAMLAAAPGARIIWMHSHPPAATAQAAARLGPLFVVAGAGNQAVGGRQLWVEKTLAEPAYLIGRAAAALTQTRRIAVLAPVTFPDVNVAANAFIAGARSAGGDVSIRYKALGAWKDPAAARAALSEFAASGVDVVFQIEGSVEACAPLGLSCAVTFLDAAAPLPDDVFAAAVAIWDADLRRALDIHAALGVGAPTTALGGPAMEASMAEGGAALRLRAALNPTLIAAVRALEAEIVAGRIQIDHDRTAPEGDPD